MLARQVRTVKSLDETRTFESLLPGRTFKTGPSRERECFRGVFWVCFALRFGLSTMLVETEIPAY